MPGLVSSPPISLVEPVTEVLHGVSVTDPYHWLEDQNSKRTREWIEQQTQYARAYLENIPARDSIRKRVRELLDVETYDSLQKVGARYFFRKRLRHREQPCIFMRESPDGEDVLLIDPASRSTGDFTVVKPVQVSADGHLLLYEVKEGGETTGKFELFNVERKETLSDFIPHGYLRGFAFAPDCRSFYYVHEFADTRRPMRWAAYRHVLGTLSTEDVEIFVAEGEKNVRLHIIPGEDGLGFLVYRFLETTHTELYRWPFNGEGSPVPIVQDANYGLSPVFAGNRILALTDYAAPNLRIVEIVARDGVNPELVEIVPQCDCRIINWTVAAGRILVSYWRQNRSEIRTFTLSGEPAGIVVGSGCETIRILGSANAEQDEIFLERESFTQPTCVERCETRTGRRTDWAKRSIPFDSTLFESTQVRFSAKDGTGIPMFLAGRKDVLDSDCHPAILTSYGGYGISMTPLFSVLVAFLMERGCLFALPNIRGGSEFGAEWYDAARRRKRQVAVDDFLSAAEWLISNGKTLAARLAIFGGSNSGLLVGAALTQRPDLFRAVVCIAPLLDMMRYHLFEPRPLWREEFGTAEDPADFEAIKRYSPYQNVQAGISYPAVMLVSGHIDRNCHPMHARKMTARLQAASSSGLPIFLDYSETRGHAPVLPLSKRISSLTDRLAFLCDQLQLPA
jgi:prolyl oligopeptidase